MESLLKRGKISVNRLFNWLLNRMTTERGILEIIWITRFIAFILLLWYFLILFPVDETKKSTVHFILLFFFLYNIGIGRLLDTGDLVITLVHNSEVIHIKGLAEFRTVCHVLESRLGPPDRPLRTKQDLLRPT